MPSLLSLSPLHFSHQSHKPNKPTWNSHHFFENSLKIARLLSGGYDSGYGDGLAMVIMVWGKGSDGDCHISNFFSRDHATLVDIIGQVLHLEAT